MRTTRIGFILIAILFLLSASTTGKAAEFSSQLQSDNPNNDTCFACHGTPGMQTSFPTGEPIYLSIDETQFDLSIHGEAGYSCVQCHKTITGYPHPERSTISRRFYSIRHYDVCEDCHQNEYNATLDSTHQKVFEAGNIEAAVCTDCHNPHYTTNPREPRTASAEMCKLCHSGIYESYTESIHGEALREEGNTDVPTCIDCHGVHNISGPTSEDSFHNKSPLLCASCHADEELMSKYDISTAVFDTYVSDFHGSTILLFEKVSPDAETNKPVCVDCHGVHDMKKVDNPESSVIKGNLLITCQKCHPDADENFPTSWLGHYEPNLEKYSLVYFVDLFYKIIIPVTLGGMAIFIGTDVYKKISQSRKVKDE